MLNIKKVQNLYGLVGKLNEFKSHYDDEFNKIPKADERINFGNLDDVFSGPGINEKKDILEKLLDMYLIKVNKLDREKTAFYDSEILPDIEELIDRTNMKGNKLIEQLYNIAIDYVIENIDEYYKNVFSQKSLAKVLLINDKNISTRLLAKGICKKNFYNKDEMDLAVKEVLSGKHWKDVAEDFGINHHTLKNEVTKIKDWEMRYNKTDAYRDITHNEIIELLGGIAIKAGLGIHSEHITRYKTNLDGRFKRIDLVCKDGNDILAAIEVEIKNDIHKSLNNLIKYYEDAKLRVLFVSEDKLEEAIVLRNKLTNVSSVKVVKISKDIENCFKGMIKEVKNLK